MNATRWEYLRDWDCSGEELDQYGGDGWELCGCWAYPKTDRDGSEDTGACYVFKRPLPPDLKQHNHTEHEHADPQRNLPRSGGDGTDKRGQG